MDVTRKLPGAISSSPEDIGAGWTDNRRAGVLSDHQMVKVDTPFFIREGQIGLNEKRRSVHMYRIINSKRAFCCQQYALRSNRLRLT